MRKWLMMLALCGAWAWTPQAQAGSTGGELPLNEVIWPVGG